MSSFLLFNFTYKMTVDQMNTKNRTYYFYNDLINIKVVKIRQKSINGSWYLLHCLCHKKNPNGMLMV